MRMDAMMRSLPKMRCGACGSDMPAGYWHSCERKNMNDGQRKRLQKKQEDALARAMAQRADRCYEGARDYCAATHVLRTEKNKSWDQVRDFFLEEGKDFSVQALITSYKRWRKEQGIE